MVVLLHLQSYGIQKAEVELHTPIYWMALLVRSFSGVAVNCFVLISGYFLCDQVVKKRKLLSQWIQVEMYSVGIYLVLCIIPKAEVTFSAKTLVRQMLPILTNQYWFLYTTDVACSLFEYVYKCFKPGRISKMSGFVAGAIFGNTNY